MYLTPIILNAEIDMEYTFIANVSCRPDMRAPGCRLCPKLQDETVCDQTKGCNRDPFKANNWCLDDCYLDPVDGICKEKSA